LPLISHEWGHHIQNLTDTGASTPLEQELQADCFAGVWANRAHQERGLIEPGDIEEALGAASAVGDDTLQQRSSGRVVPDSFTHGSATQRVRWFETGYRGGDITACDTFSAKSL